MKPLIGGEDTPECVQLKWMKDNGLVKSPSAALHCNFVVAAHL
jgi:hypothetical protein